MRPAGGVWQRNPARTQPEPWETGGKRGLYHAKFDVSAPWNCPRFPQPRCGLAGATKLKTSVRISCGTAAVIT